MQLLNLREWLESLGSVNNEYGVDNAEFIREALEMLDGEAEREAWATHCEDLDHAAPDELKGKPDKALEWLTDRSNLLDEIRDHLEKVGLVPGDENECNALDLADLVNEVIDELDNVSTELEIVQAELEAIKSVIDDADASAEVTQEYDF
jgi:vacuolar-type H+-ATPase subunit I/STV1